MTPPVSINKVAEDFIEYIALIHVVSSSSYKLLVEKWKEIEPDANKGVFEKSKHTQGLWLFFNLSYTRPFH